MQVYFPLWRPSLTICLKLCFTIHPVSRAVTKAQRLAEIPELLNLKPRTTKDLASYFDVPQRTIQRYLADLRDLGQAIEKHGDYYSIKSKSNALNPIEALAVHAAVRLLYHHSPSRNSYYRSALEKLALLLPEPARSIAAMSSDDLKNRQGDDRNLEFVARAWFDQKVLAFDYKSPTGSGRWRPKELEVYFVEISRDNLASYAIGYERSFHKRVQTWKLTRMNNARLLEDDYEIPDDFEPKHYLSTAWGVVGTSGGPTIKAKLRFVDEAANRILEGGYQNLKVTKQNSDKLIELEVIVGTNDSGFPLEILSWVRSWGAQVEVLEPLNLRQRWLEDAKTITSLYDAQKT